MNIKSIIFSDKNNSSFDRIESVISKAFNAVTENSKYRPSVFSTVQSGLPEIAQSLKENDIIIVFSDDKMYHDAKRNICKAFKFDMIHNDSVLEKLSEMENHERYMIHALMPKNATPFALSDGLFPGFAIRSKSQCIFFLPFSEDRTFVTIKKYVFPYITRVYGATLPSFNDYETAYAASVLEEQLRTAGVQIAVANTAASKYIAHAGKQIECFNDFVSYAPFDEKRANDEAKRFSAVKAAEYYECQFGAAIIEGDKDEFGNYTATITISNRKTAKIRTLSSIQDENHNDFMTTVVTEFFLMLAQELMETPLMSADEIKKHISPSPVISKANIVLYVILFATAFFLTYVASTFSNLAFFS